MRVVNLRIISTAIILFLALWLLYFMLLGEPKIHKTFSPGTVVQEYLNGNGLRQGIIRLDRVKQDNATSISPSGKLELEDLDAYVTNQTVKNFARTSSIFYPVESVEMDRIPTGSTNVSLEDEEFTIVMMTYKRTEMMLKLLEHLSRLPKLNQLLLIWNNEELPDSSIKWPSVGYRVRLLANKRNELHNRYLPLSIIKTEAIFLLDDDSFVIHDKVLEAFEIWQAHRDRIVGFKGRGVKYIPEVNGTLGQWKYDAVPKDEAVSLVLTGSAFIHRNFMDLYTYEMPTAMRKIIDDTMNCDDIAVNILVSDRTQKSPIYIPHTKGFMCPGCTDNGLWKDASHFVERSKCLNQFAEIMGYLPLFKQGSAAVLKAQDCSKWPIFSTPLNAWTTSKASYGNAVAILPQLLLCFSLITLHDISVLF